MRLFNHQGRAAEERAGRIILKSPRELELMRAAGRVVHGVLQRLRAEVAPGVTTGELSRIAERMVSEAGGEALFRGQTTKGVKFPFPAGICTSVNDEVVHGIPGARRLNEGDIVSVDCGVRLRGYCGDSALTIPVGKISPSAQRLLDTTVASLDLAIAEMRPGRMWSDVAREIQRLVESAGYSVVREFVGHGIGQGMHEEPKVPNYAERGKNKGDFRLEPGLVIAVEPMVNERGPGVESGDSTGWVQVTKDGGLSAHFEHTVAVVPGGVDVLTDGR